MPFLHCSEHYFFSPSVPNTNLLCVSCSLLRTQCEACTWVSAILCVQNASFLSAVKLIESRGISIPDWLAWKWGSFGTNCEDLGVHLRNIVLKKLSRTEQNFGCKLPLNAETIIIRCSDFSPPRKTWGYLSIVITAIRLEEEGGRGPDKGTRLHLASWHSFPCLLKKLPFVSFLKCSLVFLDCALG